MIAYTLLLLALLVIIATWRLRVAARKVDAILEEELGEHPGDDGQFSGWPTVRAPEA